MEKVKEAHSNFKSLISKNWFSVILCVFSVSYIALSMSFLNELYVKDLLFSWQSPIDPENPFLSFSQDIFDVFWIIFAAILNGIFTFSLFRKLSNFLKDNDLPHSPLWVGELITVFVLVINIYEYTSDFINTQGTWSAALSAYTEIEFLYFLLQLIATIILSVEITCAICGTAYMLFVISAKPDLISSGLNLISRIFNATIIIALYWVMLVLSGVSNDKHLGMHMGRSVLFSGSYYWMGIGISAFIAIHSAIFIKFYRDSIKSRNDIIITIIIPCIPIIIQLLQIIF